MKHHCYLRFVSFFLLLLGGACLGYGGYLYLCYGVISFAWTFPVMGLCLLSGGLWERYHQKHLFTYFPLRMQKPLLGILSIMFCVFLLLQGSIIYEGRRPSREQSDYVIVLGAQLKGSTITRSLRYRLEAAWRYAQTYPNAILIVSGGQGRGESISEAEAMRDWLITHGVADQRILMETSSTNTQENFKYALQMIKDDTDHVSIITNGFHMKRSKMLCEKTMKTCSTYPAKTGDDMAIIFYFREVFAYIKDWLLS